MAAATGLNDRLGGWSWNFYLEGNSLFSSFSNISSVLLLCSISFLGNRITRNRMIEMNPISINKSLSCISMARDEGRFRKSFEGRLISSF